MQKVKTRKRPCRVCRRWYLPNPRLKDRQMTCGRPKCQREWHRRKCVEWYRKNPDYFKTNYLAKKIEAATEAPKADYAGSSDPAFRFKFGLPYQLVQEVIGIEHLVVIEYQTQLIVQHCHRLMKRQSSVDSRPICRQSGMTFSRGDPASTSCKN